MAANRGPHPDTGEGPGEWLGTGGQSLIRGIYISASAMVTQMAQQDVIANNLANLNTTGFKRDLAIFRARDEKQMLRIAPFQPGTGAPATISQMGSIFTDSLLDQVSTAHSQGDLKGTDNPTDVALRGRAFFVVQTAQGEALTRNGAFELDTAGYIVDHGGNPVLGQAGPIRLPEAQRSSRFYVGDDGTVSVAGQVLDRMRIEDVQDPMNQLEKRGNTYYYPRQGVTPYAAPTRNFSVHQNFLEMSSASPISEMVNMINALRTYEASQRTMNTQDETLGRAVNDVGRV